ncbi:MAG: phage antirepressor [Selenomonadaceae bacterium]|nr:phage antirepressor [Selenomonadaceae bacterium]
MNELQIFNNDEFGQVRIVEIDGEPWFVAADVCRVLEIGNPSQALTRLDDDEKGIISINTRGGEQPMCVVNESGLYALVLKSRKPDAKRFRKWLTSEVVPSIRKNGIYLNPNAPIDPRFLRKMADELEARDKQIAALTARVDELQPKADYAESILRCQDAVPITLIAKDYGYGAASFNELLHTFRIQFKTGGTWALYQPYAKMGYAVTTPEILKDGLTVTHMRWTQKGRMFLYNVLKRENIVPVIERDDHTISLF